MLLLIVVDDEHDDDELDVIPKRKMRDKFPVEICHSIEERRNICKMFADF